MTLKFKYDLNFRDQDRRRVIQSDDGKINLISIRTSREKVTQFLLVYESKNIVIDTMESIEKIAPKQVRSNWMIIRVGGPSLGTAPYDFKSKDEMREVLNLVILALRAYTGKRASWSASYHEVGLVEVSDHLRDILKSAH